MSADVRLPRPTVVGIELFAGAGNDLIETGGRSIGTGVRGSAPYLFLRNDWWSSVWAEGW